MGYCINVKQVQFKMKKANQNKAFRAIKKAISHPDYLWFPGDHSFLNNPKSGIKEALEGCRWVPRFNLNGDIIDLDFCGEKLGDDEQLFVTIAPFVESGSFIEIHGEDDYIWRWVFKGKLEECGAVIDFENHKGMIDALLKQKGILPTLLGIHPDLDKKISEVLLK